MQPGLLRALGYAVTPRHLELLAGCPCRSGRSLGTHKAPQLVVVPAYNPGQEEDDVLDQSLAAVHYDGVPVPPVLAEADAGSPLSPTRSSARTMPPRYIVLSA